MVQHTLCFPFAEGVGWNLGGWCLGEGLGKDIRLDVFEVFMVDIGESEPSGAWATPVRMKTLVLNAWIGLGIGSLCLSLLTRCLGCFSGHWGVHVGQVALICVSTSNNSN